VSISGLEAKLREVIDRAIRRVFPKRSAAKSDRSRVVERLRGSSTSGMTTDEILGLTRNDDESVESR
jgi:hypothetical protein